MTAKTIAFGDHVYELVMGQGCLDRLDQRLQSGRYDRFVVVADSGVPETVVEAATAALSRRGPVHPLRFPAGEDHKTVLTVAYLAEEAVRLGADRRTAIVGVGGGLTGNVAGMVAGLLYRGLPLIHVPVTLMAASDSVLSLKQAVNLGRGKNLIGLYWTPDLVVIDLDVLTRLPKRHIQAGLCEMVKNLVAILPDRIPSFRERLRPSNDYGPAEMEEFVSFCVEAKSRVMRDDPYERGPGLVLEYGHTVGHALELAEEGRYLHGECVAFGMVCAARLSNRLGYLSPADVAVHEELLSLVGVEVVPSRAALGRIAGLIGKDNKRGYRPGAPGKTGLVLLRRLGEVLRDNGFMTTLVDDAVLLDVVAEVAADGLRPVAGKGAGGCACV